MQSGDSYRLVVRRGPQPNQIYELTKDVNTLGRDITNDIVINDREVSRHHLRIMRTADGITIEDLGSTNGTFVNGKRITGVIALQNGDMVGLGETVTLGYEIHRAGSPVAPSAPAPDVTAPSSVPPAGEASPYQAPQQDSPYQPPAQQPGYGGEAYDQQQAGGYYEQQPQYNQYPPQPPQGTPGYDYDPYAMREYEEGGSARWLVLGCLVFLRLGVCLLLDCGLGRGRFAQLYGVMSLS